jgi:hypothetical protein
MPCRGTRRGRANDSVMSSMPIDCPKRTAAAAMMGALFAWTVPGRAAPAAQPCLCFVHEDGTFDCRHAAMSDSWYCRREPSSRRCTGEGDGGVARRSTGEARTCATALGNISAHRLRGVLREANWDDCNTCGRRLSDRPRRNSHQSWAASRYRPVPLATICRRSRNVHQLERTSQSQRSFSTFVQSTHEIAGSWLPRDSAESSPRCVIPELKSMLASKDAVSRNGHVHGYRVLGHCKQGCCDEHQAPRRGVAVWRAGTPVKRC